MYCNAQATTGSPALQYRSGLGLPPHELSRHNATMVARPILVAPMRLKGHIPDANTPISCAQPTRWRSCLGGAGFLTVVVFVGLLGHHMLTPGPSVLSRKSAARELIADVTASSSGLLDSRQQVTLTCCMCIRRDI